PPHRLAPAPGTGGRPSVPRRTHGPRSGRWRDDPTAPPQWRGAPDPDRPTTWVRRSAAPGSSRAGRRGLGEPRTRRRGGLALRPSKGGLSTAVEGGWGSRGREASRNRRTWVARAWRYGSRRRARRSRHRHRPACPAPSRDARPEPPPGTRPPW